MFTLEFAKRSEAHIFLDYMQECIRDKGYCSVKDIKKGLGEPYTDADKTVGFTDLSRAYIRQTKNGGYQIVRPRKKQ